MEAVTLTAGAIATLIFSKAVEKGGEKLGEAVSEKIGQLVKVIFCDCQCGFMLSAFLEKLASLRGDEQIVTKPE